MVIIICKMEAYAIKYMTHFYDLVAEDCEDTLDKYSADLKNVNCTHIVNSNYCGNKYYGKYCCKSCAIAAVFKKNMKKAKGTLIFDENAKNR